jgi:hypothetical protein
MLSFTHTIISLPLGVHLSNPLIIFLLAIALHLIADMFLHWNIYPQLYKRFPYGRVAFDVLGGLAVAFLLVGNDIITLPILAAIAGGNAPDAAHSLWLIADGERHPEKWPRWVNAIFGFHHNIQRETPSITKGLISQIIAIALALALIF